MERENQLIEGGDTTDISLSEEEKRSEYALYEDQRRRFEERMKERQAEEAEEAIRQKLQTEKAKKAEEEKREHAEELVKQLQERRAEIYPNFPIKESIAEKFESVINEEYRDIEDEAMKELFKKFDASKSDSIGWVQKHEVKIAKKRIREALGFEPLPMCGFWMAVAVNEESSHIKTADGRKTSLIMAENFRENSKFGRCSGLVISQGAWCYKGVHFTPPLLERITRFFFGRWMEPSIYRPWCRVGDYVAMAANEGQLVNFRGIPVMIVKDTKIYSPIENPDHVKREF